MDLDAGCFVPNWPLIFLSLLILLIFLPNLPLNNVPERDSGVFLYVGEQILDGKTPYWIESLRRRYDSSYSSHR